MGCNMVVSSTLRRNHVALLFAALLPVLSGCMFDVVSIRQEPASFTTRGVASESFRLNREYVVSIGTGFPTTLKAGSRWSRVGAIDRGAVFFTEDQIVKVEASNIHEARIVVSEGRLVGFYLPVEKTFAPISSPIELDRSVFP